MKKQKKPLILLTSIVTFAIIFLFFIFYPKNVQKSSALPVSTEINGDEIEQYLRLFNTERYTLQSKQKARTIIRGEFESFGYRVREEKFGNYINLIAERGETSKPTLIGAHYDTVPGSKGGDDNGSGLAAMLSVARHNANPNVVFAAFDAEEVDLLGSNHYEENNPAPSLVIIFETMGYKSESEKSQKSPPLFNVYFRGLYQRLKDNDFKGNFSTAVCAPNAKKECELYEAAGKSQNLEVYNVEIPSLNLLKGVFWDMFRSDHTSFLKKNIPSFMITDTANFRNKNYHLPTDTVDKLDSLFIAKQANAVLETVKRR